MTRTPAHGAAPSPVRSWRGRRGAALLAGMLLAAAATALGLRTAGDLEPPPRSLDVTEPEHDSSGAGLRVRRGEPLRVRLLDRNGEPLNVTFTDAWNVHDRAALHEVPVFLRTAFVVAEDKRFYSHTGVDWSARLAALTTNVRNLRTIRGASTITEQVVRMLHPRPRTLWSRWLEGLEAIELERRFTKDEILEFYLNQVPYASNRRGVRQAARHYFARDLGTLSRKEMLALAVLVRAPTRLDLARDRNASAGAIERLAAGLVERGMLTAAAREELLAEPFALEAPRLAVSAPHFVQRVRAEIDASPRTPAARITTTLDARLQARAQRMLDERLRHLRRQQVGNGAVLAVDHTTGEVLAWVVAGGGEDNGPASHIDAVTTPRQPGSALKPFLYALALDSGWSAAQVIEDAPLVESTSGGLHSYRNYSRRFYGAVTLRDALGNSLNIPALKTLQHVGAEAYLKKLHALGFAGLTSHPDFYGDGIALGSGAVTLFELVQAYAALANRGVFRPLVTHGDAAPAEPARRVFSAEAASLIANILADADARALEFGRDSVLAFPVETAVKTGTSTDFRDAWAVGFNYRYTVGAWIGNLDQTPSDGVTGSTGPALLLRGVFAELSRDVATKPLFLSPRLTRKSVCVPMPQSAARAGECVERNEWFLPQDGPDSDRAGSTATEAGIPPRIRFSQPTDGLELAYDPRLPPESQEFEFSIQGLAPDDRVAWVIDGHAHSVSNRGYRWKVTRGAHRVAATVWRDDVQLAELAEVSFTVK